MKALKMPILFFLIAALLAGCATREPAPATQADPHDYTEADGRLVPPVVGGDVVPVPISREEEDYEQNASAVMSVDFAAIADLDTQAKGWGHGGPVDDRNRSTGALLFQERYGKYGAHFIRSDSEDIYFTFDQGYEYGFTPVILDTLRDKGVPGAFFLTMHFAQSHPDLVRRMIDEGHVLANHSTAHRNFPSMPLSEAMEDVRQLHDYVLENFGYEMNLFRFPEGSFSEQTLALLHEMGYQSVFWSFAYRDWEIDNQPLTIEATNKITKSAHPGGIYLFHSVSRTNSEILGDVIDNMRAQGFEFARLEL